MNVKELTLQSAVNRKRLMEIVYNAKAGHIGGDLSSLNVMTALYSDIMNISPAQVKDPNRDRFILSKGHCVEALYTVLESRGFIAPSLTNTSLGHGLSIGVGMAIAAKMDKRNYKTYVLMGDGEQGEGSIYEAAMAGHQYKLDNLVAIIDRNHLQISGNTEDVMALDSIPTRWSAFGWDVKEMNGDDMQSIKDTFANIDYNNGKPHLIVSNTTKGKGISFMENVASWHHGMPNEEQYQQAMVELNQAIEELKSQL